MSSASRALARAHLHEDLEEYKEDLRQPYARAHRGLSPLEVRYPARAGNDAAQPATAAAAAPAAIPSLHVNVSPSPAHQRLSVSRVGNDVRQVARASSQASREAQSRRVPMPGPGGRAARAAQLKAKEGSSGNKLTACFRTPLHPSTIFDTSLTSLYAPYTRLPAFLTASLALLDACLADGSIRADQLFQSTGPDRVREESLQDLVNFMEEDGEGAGVTPQSLSYYGCQTVSAFLMRFLEHLPDPLLTYARYEQFLKTANVSPDSRGRGANAAFKAAFPLAAGPEGADELDQIFIMQSLVVTLPGAHYLLLQHMLLLFKRMLEADALASPKRMGGFGGHAYAGVGATPMSPSMGLLSPSSGGQSSTTSVSLQRISLLFCSTLLVPLHIPGSAPVLDSALRKAQEQQVLVYLVQHYEELYERHPIRMLYTQPAPPPSVDPNPTLIDEAALWRRRAGTLKLVFSRRFFDDRTIVRVFRSWRAMSKSNRRKAECYRQLALLKSELVAEKHKNGHKGVAALLSRELYGLKEEFELRDFAQQLREQVDAVSSGRMGVGGALVPLAAAGNIAYPSPAPHASPAGGMVRRGGGTAQTPYVVGGSAVKPRTGGEAEYEEKSNAEASAQLVASLSTGSRGGQGGGGAPAVRDLSADLAAVRALQEQDRMLTSAYARIIPEPRE